MCYFVTIGLSDASVKKLSKPSKRGMSFSQYDHPHLRQHFHAGYSPWLLTSGGCSCDLFVSDQAAEDETVSNKVKQERLSPEVADFLESLVRSYGPVYLFIHFYKAGDMAEEKLTLTKSIKLPVTRLKQLLPVDQLWWVTL